MFRSGRAVCTGGKDEDNIHTGIERMTADLQRAGIKTWDLKDVEIEVQNMVATYALHYPEDYDGNDKWTNEPLAGKPRKLNLNNLTFHLPFDKVEYEPEQFPGLIYRLDYPKVVCLIFGSGKMVITGARHKDEILEATKDFHLKVNKKRKLRHCDVAMQKPSIPSTTTSGTVSYTHLTLPTNREV